MRHADLTVRQATIADAAAVASLFDAYRQFYGKSADLALAEEFVRHRLSNGDSLILVAEARSVSAEPLGFVQPYPTFSSPGCNRAWILNDLYVVQRARRGGVAEALMGLRGAPSRTGRQNPLCSPGRIATSLDQSRSEKPGPRRRA